MVTKVRLAPGITLTTMDGKTVLFSRSTGDFHGLNGSAAHMLRTLLDSDFDATVATCSQQYGVEHDVIATDLAELVDTLADARLVVRERG